jgi:hypothetical protein
LSPGSRRFGGGNKKTLRRETDRTPLRSIFEAALPGAIRHWIAQKVPEESFLRSNL